MAARGTGSGRSPAGPGPPDAHPTASGDRSERQQAHPGQAEQGEGVEVALAAQQPPVQAGRCGAAAVPPLQVSEHVAGGDPASHRHDGGHRFVGAPPPVGMRHHHHPAPGQRPGQGDPTRAGGPDGCPARSRQVDPAVAGAVRCPGQPQATDHPQRPIHRRAPADDGHRKRRTTGRGCPCRRPHGCGRPHRRYWCDCGWSCCGW